MEDPTFPIPKLPNDLIVEILTWLPVKPLLKFKCVCKSWRALISSSQFVKSHLENSKLDRNFTTQRLLMQFGGNFKQLSANSMLHEPISEAFDLNSPFQLGGRIKAVLGSCNGLLCLAALFPIPGNDIDSAYYRTELILWNPSTKIRKQLPDFELNAYPAEDHDITNYGFGYDKSSDDYKVVRFANDAALSKVMLQVYSLRNDQWKTAKTRLGMRYLEMLRPATFVNGKLYWIGSQSNDPCGEDLFVVCFDLETEECDDEMLRLPKCVRFDHSEWLGECGGSLRVMCFHSAGSDVWSLDGRGVGNENWAKVVTFPRLRDFWWFPRCVLYVMNSPVLFLASGPVAISDAKGCSLRYHEIKDTGYFRVRGAYIESLVSPLG